MTGIVAGALYEFALSGYIPTARARLPRSACFFEKGDVIAVTWVEPDAEAAVPWIRETVIVTSHGLATVSLSALERHLRHGSLVRVDCSQGKI